MSSVIKGGGVCGSGSFPSDCAAKNFGKRTTRFCLHATSNKKKKTSTVLGDETFENSALEAAFTNLVCMFSMNRPTKKKVSRTHARKHRGSRPFLFHAAIFGHRYAFPGRLTTNRWVCRTARDAPHHPSAIFVVTPRISFLHTAPEHLAQHVLPFCVWILIVAG